MATKIENDENAPLGAVTFSLEFPIKDKTKTIDTLVLKRPIAKNLRNIKPNMSNDDIICILGEISGLGSSVINKLDVKDFMDLASEFSFFLAGGDETEKLL